MASNSFIGKLVLTLVFSLFLYYTFWIAVLPFVLVEEDNLIYSLFPPIGYAFLIPQIFGILFIGGLSVFTLHHIRPFIFNWFYKGKFNVDLRSRVQKKGRKNN